MYKRFDAIPGLEYRQAPSISASGGRCGINITEPVVASHPATCGGIEANGSRKGTGETEWDAWTTAAPPASTATTAHPFARMRGSQDSDTVRGSFIASGGRW